MDALQSDIDSLEQEKTAVQTKLNNVTKKQMYDSLTKGTSNIGSAVGMFLLGSSLADVQLNQADIWFCCMSFCYYTDDVVLAYRTSCVPLCI